MIPVYTITLFLSAALLFSIQPMVGRMILAAFGGAPAVWNACMVFFQAALLGGYAYAHVSVSRLGARRQSGMHLLLLAAGLFMLPVAVIMETDAGAVGSPVAWIWGRMLLAIGLPVFAVAATAPLLQKWFAETEHPAAQDPYFLYAASNAGSLLALLAYPFMIERMLTLTQQGRAWSVAYLVLIVLIAVCAAMLWRSTRRAGSTQHRENRQSRDREGEVETQEARGAGVSGKTSTGETPVPHPTGAIPAPHPTGWKPVPHSPESRPPVPHLPAARRVRWLLLAAVPSSLMLGVTAHITTNIAAMPLLWVIPLALYLLTFVLVFARRPLLSHDLMVLLFPFGALLIAPLFFVSVPELEWRLMIIHLVVFLLAAMVCHGELAKDRPRTDHLTSFYLWIAIGGVAGGLFNALAAPLLFDDVVEYPLMMVAACLLWPGLAASGRAARDRDPRVRSEAGAASAPRRGRSMATARRHGIPELARDIVWPLAIAGLVLGLVAAIHQTEWQGTFAGLLLVLLVVIVAGFVFRRRPVRFGLTYAVGLVALGLFVRLQEGDVLHAERDFFGVKRVIMYEGHFHRFHHGTTVHGTQRVRPAFSTEPLAYYHRNGPVGDLFQDEVMVGRTRRVAAVGLGVGAVASYARPDQRFTFYEIDPAVVRIARDPRYFTFLAECSGAVEIVIGDGRIELGRAPDGHYDLIFMDAYSSDAIPVHLLTREAVELYLSKLSDDGRLAFHISNRFMNLEPIVGNLAHELRLVGRVRVETGQEVRDAGSPEEAFPAHVAVVARSERALGSLTGAPGWRPLTRDPTAPVWTDRYSDIVTPLLAGPHVAASAP